MIVQCLKFLIPSECEDGDLRVRRVCRVYVDRYLAVIGGHASRIDDEDDINANGRVKPLSYASSVQGT